MPSHYETRKKQLIMQRKREKAIAKKLAREAKKTLLATVAETL